MSLPDIIAHRSIYNRPPWYSILLVVCGLALVGGSVLLDRPLHSYAVNRRLSLLRLRLIFRQVCWRFRPIDPPRHRTPLRELLQYGLSPDLFTSSGTSIEVAVETVVNVFSMLPQDLREASRKIALIVSDGEDTAAAESLGYALADLSSQPFDVIALQAGSLDTPEGVPRYDQVGEFLGFEMMSGNIYSTPDIKTMNAIPRASPQRGLYVRAEEPDAVEEVLKFVVDGQFRNQQMPGRLFFTLSLLGIVALICARVLQ